MGLGCGGWQGGNGRKFSFAEVDFHWDTFGSWRGGWTLSLDGHGCRLFRLREEKKKQAERNSPAKRSIREYRRIRWLDMLYAPFYSAGRFAAGSRSHAVAMCIITLTLLQKVFLTLGLFKNLMRSSFRHSKLRFRVRRATRPFERSEKPPRCAGRNDQNCIPKQEF